MKKQIQIIRLLTGLFLVIFVLAACQTTPTTTASTTAAPTETTETTATETTKTGEAAITDGIFECRWTPEGYSELVNYIHFYPNGIFYLSLYNGDQYLAGYYEIKEMEIEYMPDKDKPDEKEKADRAVVLTNLDGSEYATLAYANDTLYNMPTLYDRNFVHIPDADHNPEDETGVAIEEFMLGDDDYSLVRLMHNGTFQDTIGEFIEGTWQKDGNVYTLTEAETNKTYTLTLSEDGNTATYQGLDGKTLTLNRVMEAKTVLTFKGSAEGEYGAMEITIDCTEDGKCSLLVEYAGTENKSSGTWELAADKQSITLSINDASYTATLDPEDNSFSFEFVISDGKKDITVAMTTKTEVETVYTFVGESNDKVIMECYSDGTCAVIYSGMGTITTGTWEMDTTSQLPKWSIVLAETADGKDAEVNVETDYATKFYFTFKDASGQLEEVLALPFSALQSE